jgi:acyl-CoA synthetase (NDP forming)
MTARAPLEALLAPRRVAVIGSTSRDSGIGSRTLRHLREGGFGGDVQVARTAADVSGEVDVAVVAVPAAAAHEVLDGLAGRAAYVIVNSSGFEESGGPPLRLAPGTGTRIIGPNSVGLYYGPTRTTLTFAAAFDGALGGPSASRRDSGIFLVSQSGAFGARLVQSAHRYGVAVDGFVGSGNETDYGACDLAADLIASPAYRPRVIALYLESVRDGAALRAMLRSAAEHEVSVVILLGGESGTGAQAARSHTAAVIGSHAAVTGMCALYGAVLVQSDRELAESMIGLSLLGRARGSRVAVVTGSGGAGVVAVDMLARRGVAVPALSTALRDRLARRLPAYASTANPVDVTAQTIGDTGTLAALCGNLAESGEADCLLVVGRAGQAQAVTEAVTEAGGGRVPVIVCALDADPSSVSPSVRAGLAVLPGLEAACNVARAVTLGAGAAAFRSAPDALSAPDARDPDMPGHGTFPPQALDPDALDPDAPDPDAATSLRLVAGAGLAVAPWRLAHSVPDALAAGHELGWPVVLKANLPAGAHKALSGGVRLDVGKADVEAAAKELLALAPALIVARQLRAAPEMFVGVRRDPLAGLMVAAGLGGGHVELISRVVSVPADAPADWLRSQLAAEVFDRGGPRYAALPGLLATAAAALTRLAASRRLSVVECNPLILVDDRLVALDARVITHD